MSLKWASHLKLESGSSNCSHGARTCAPSTITMWRNSLRNLLGGQCTSSRWPLVWFKYEHELYSHIWFAFRCQTDKVVNCTCMSNWWGRVANGGLRYLCTGCPAPDIGYKYCLEWNVWDTVSTFIHLPRMFHPWIFSSNNELNNLPCLHQIHIIN